MATAQQGPRARYREQTRTEIKETALRQLADGGVAALALTRIAKERYTRNSWSLKLLGCGLQENSTAVTSPRRGTV
ncbi:hypothetical protein ABZS83_34290, partial [Streptomyces sp. NPDC005426]